MLVPIPQMRTGRQHQRPRYAEMGEQHLAELAEYGFPLLIPGGKLHIFQRQPLHPSAAGIIAHQRHQGAVGLHNGVSRLLCHAVAVSGGACPRIGHTPRSQNHRPGRVVRLFPRNRANSSLPAPDGYRPVMLPPHAQFFHPPPQRPGYVKRAVRHGKHPVPPLCFQWHADPLKKSHRICACKAIESAVKEFTITGNMGHQLLRRTVIGHVAPAFSGDIQFFSQPLIGLQQAHSRPLLRRRNSCHHTGGSAADDHDLLIHLPHTRKPHTGTTLAPAPKTSPMSPSSFADPPPESAHSADLPGRPWSPRRRSCRCLPAATRWTSCIGATSCCP